MQKNKLTIVLLSLGIACGIGLTVWFTVANPFSKTQTKIEEQKKDAETNKQVVEASGKTAEEVSKMTKDEKEGYLYGDGKGYSDSKFRLTNGKQEYPQNESKNLEKELMDYATVASFDKIIERVKPLINEYNFTEGNNLRVASIYHDASVMLTTITVPQFQAGKIAKAMIDPEMTVIGTMMLPEKARREVITDKDSLSPIFEGAVKIKKHEVLRGDTKDFHGQQTMNITVGAEFVHKVEFEIENGNTLYAYVSEFRDASLELYGIYAPEGKNYNYQNIRFWEKVDQDFDKHTELQQTTGK